MNAQGPAPRRRPAVHQLHVNDKALGLMIDAIAKLSHQRRCFATLSDVLLHALEHRTAAESPAISDLGALQSLVGEHKVYVRIPRESARQFDALKHRVGDALPGKSAVREAVCYCCLIILNCKN